MKKTILKRGFTLIEVMVVVGVIAALTGIAIPTISGLRKSMDTKQESNYAKDVYLAIQDNFTSQRTDGSLSGLVLKEYPSVYVNEESWELVDTIKAILPAELQTELAEKDKNREYVWTTNADETAFYSILPLTSIDQSIIDPNIRITVVFNEITGDVLYVKYGDDGEYMGSVVNLADEIRPDNTITPVLTVVNGQECYAKVSIPVPSEYALQCNEFFKAITFNFTMQDTEDPSRTLEASFRATDSPQQCFTYTVQTGTCVAKWTIDSLVYHFADKFDHEGATEPIPAGNYVNVSVQCDFDEDSDMVVAFDDSPQTSQAFNPLFENVVSTNADGTTTMSDPEGKTVISISNGRHLQNLNYVEAGIAATLSAKTIPTEVKLTGDIAWGDTVSYYENWFSKSRISTSEYANYVTKWLYFRSIEPSGLFSRASTVTVNGNGKKIINLYIIDQTDKGVGLFRELYTTVSNLSFVDPVVIGTGDTGVVAGKAVGTNEKNAAIVNCNVSINSENRQQLSTEEATTTTVYFGASCSSDNKSVGLLVGDAKYCTVEGGKIETAQGKDTVYTRVTSSDYGLIAGNAENCKVSDTRIVSSIYGGTAAADVGAAVGKMKNSTVSGVNVSGLLRDIAAENLGGLIGCCDGGCTVTGCTFSGTVSCKDGGSVGTLGGLVGKATGGTYENNTVSGSLQNIRSRYFGGAFGAAFGGGTYKNNSVTGGTMTVVSVDDLGADGSPVSVEYGAYACPTYVSDGSRGCGYAGQFVGYIESGTFTNCTSSVVPSGTKGTVDYGKMQFVGVVKCTTASQNVSGNYYLPVAQFDTYSSVASSTDKDTVLSFISAATEKSFTSLVLHTYDDISFSNCIYKDTNTVDYYQTIASEGYYDVVTKTPVNRVTGSLNVGGKYLLISADGNYLLYCGNKSRKQYSVCLKNISSYEKDENGELYADTLNELIKESDYYVWYMENDSMSGNSMWVNYGVQQEGLDAKYLSWSEDESPTMVRYSDATEAYEDNYGYNVNVDMYSAYAYIDPDKSNGNGACFAFYYAYNEYVGIFTGYDSCVVESVAVENGSFKVILQKKNYSDFYVRYINSEEMTFPIPSAAATYWRVYDTDNIADTQKNYTLTRKLLDNIIYSKQK